MGLNKEDRSTWKCVAFYLAPVIGGGETSNAEKERISFSSGVVSIPYVLMRDIASADRF